MDFPKHVRGVVVERRDLTRDLWIVRLRTERPVEFVPGQYVTIGLLEQNKLVERPYSAASAPEEEALEFFIEEVPGGKLTPYLHQVPVGGEVYVRPAAKGRFTLQETAERPNHFMVATVTGIAPFAAMVRHLAARETDTGPPQLRVAILHGASVAPELGLRAEMAARARERSWFRYIPTVSRTWLDPEWRGERGRVEDVARKYMDEMGFGPGSTTAYLCGNPHMIRQMRGVLERAGFERHHVKEETYWPE
ncbi:MAG TPA: FAD-binding oxidoreductase [Bryobacteraceae bacterium]|jgi:ferredoxin--NADP+ reductase|nr:FAD-binding oxidoreductase [Bryobacteraceae bacterium]